MLRRIAVVGGNGFVGRHVLATAVARGIEALGIVRSDDGARIVHGLGATPLRAPNLDRPSTTALVGALSGVEGVVYTASVSTGLKGADRTDPSGLQNVLDACAAAQVPRIVLFSGLGIAHYGMNPHCTNPYFLAKMAGEVAAFRSPLSTTVFRPSYIFGLGDEFLSPLVRRLDSNPRIEIPGDGEYRLQPIAVEDAARAALGALSRDDADPRVVDLVGPDIVSYRELIRQVSLALSSDVTIDHRPISEAIAMARQSDYFGLRAHDLACLLCDEVSQAAPVETLASKSLDRLDEIIARVVTAIRAGRDAV